MLAAQELETSLKETNDLRAALDAHAIVAITDPQGKITYVNDKFCAISKYSREELIGQDHRIINSGYHPKEFIRDLWVTITHGKVWKGEIKNRAKDGSFYWVDTTIVPFLDAHGKPRQYVAIRADITARKQAEGALAQLAAIVQFSDDAIIGKDLQSIITSWNNGAERIFGYSAAEMVGTSIVRLIPEERRNEEDYILTKIKSGESVEHFETVRQTRDGRLIDVSVTASPIKDGGGRIVGVSKIARDITEQKKAEELARSSFKEICDLKSALDEHAIVAITDPQGKITYVNDKFCAISKYSREELLGQDHRIINSGHHPKEFIRDLWTTIAHGRVWHGEIKNKAKDGSFYWVDTTIVPFLNEDGKPRQYVAIRADITGRKRAEEERRAGEARYRSLFEYAPYGILIADPQGVYLDANSSICRMLGYEPGKLVGKQAADIVAEAEKEHIAPAIDTIMTGPDGGREWQFRRRDGSVFPVDVMATKMPDGNIMALVNDITERKEAEERIRNINIELEKRVAERTTELEAANKELEAFSYSVSHDLRAPLRAVNGFAGIVLEDFSAQLPEEGRRYLERIRNGGQRMGELIDDLLAFSRLSRQPVNRQPVNTTRLVQGVLEGLKPQRDGQQIELRVGKLPPCEADPALLRQVWVNLLSNAVKYSRDRAPAVVEAGCAVENGGNVYFVRDNGAGFDMKYANKLFGVFQRLHRTDEFEGTGVGLAIVHRIVQRHGGRVWAESKVNEGSVFYFTIEGEN